jgi:general secretion pathway protein E
VYEILVVSEPVRELIMKRANAEEVKQQAIKEGMKTMIEDGIKKALGGLTTVEEVLRATRE